MQNQQAKKPTRIEQTSIQFKCKVPNHQCWSKDKKGNIKVCSWSPCPLNLYKFSMHGRIIENYLDNEEWDDSYYYFDSLLSNLPISCDLEHLKNNPNTKINDLPPGCRVFKESFELKDIKRILKRYNKLELLKGGEISKTGKSIYESEKLKFAKKLHGNLERLKHLAKDKQVKRDEANESQEKVKDLIDKAMEAAIKYGVNVKDNVGDFIEKGFENAAQGTGLEIKKHAERNKKRIEEAKVAMKKNKLIEELRKELTERGNISQESIEKLEKTLQKIEGN